jgi:hypothetical protein
MWSDISSRVRVISTGYVYDAIIDALLQEPRFSNFIRQCGKLRQAGVSYVHKQHSDSRRERCAELQLCRTAARVCKRASTCVQTDTVPVETAPSTSNQPRGLDLMV